jgi:urea transport system ATP-binding protein
MAIVLVEQYFDFAFGLADQIFAMTRGEIVYESRTATIDKARLRQSVGV